MSRIVVVGGGVGGLATAALLARAGLDVTVLEAHIYAGGSASTFYHQGYRFDAGATLPAGFYPGGPMDLVAQAVGIDRWPVRPDDPAMVVHLPDGASVTRYGGKERWAERRRAFGPEAEPFWRWQETTSDALWDLALRLPTWPPQTPGEAARLAGDGLAWMGSDLRMRLKPSLALRRVPPGERPSASPFPWRRVRATAALCRRPTAHRRPDDESLYQCPLWRVGAGPAPPGCGPR